MLLTLNQNSNPVEVSQNYFKTRRRLLMFEYDGVMVPYELRPDLTEPSDEVKSTLKKLSRDPRNVIMLISGRDTAHLDKFWKDATLILVAENGAFYRVPEGSWQSLFSASNDWMDRVANALRALTLQFPGSFIEQKNHSLIWHHRTTLEPVYDSELRQIQAATRALNHSGLFNIRYNEYALELSTSGIDPGSFIARWIGGQTFDFILAMGAAKFEEHIFPILTENANTIRVGKMTSSRANFHISEQASVIQFLKELVKNSDGGRFSWRFNSNGPFGKAHSKPDIE